MAIAAPERPITGKDVLAYTNNPNVLPSFNPDILAAQDHAAELRRNAGSDGGKAAFQTRIDQFRNQEAARKPADERVKSMKLAFGGGEAVVDPATGDVKIRDEASQSTKDAYAEVQQPIDTIGRYLKYSDISAAIATGRSEIDVLTDAGMSIAEWDTLKNQIGNDLLALDGIRDLFDLDPSITAAEASEFLETAMAADPGMRNEVNKRLKAVELKLGALPPVPPEDSTVVTLREAKKTADANVKAGMDDIYTKLSLLGSAEDNQANRDFIMAKIKELSEADKKSKIPVPTGGTPTPPPDYTAAVTAVMGQLNVAGAVTAPTRAAVETSLKAMVPTSDNAENAQQALDKKLSSSAYKTAEAERQRAVSARLVQEATLREELNGIIPTAIAEQTHKRYEEITRLQEVANKKNKENAKNSAVAIVGDAMSKDWIENNLDKRERIIHGKQIQADMLHLIYARDAEYGVKQLMLRALSEKNGWDVDPATGVRNPDFWKTANLDTLPADQKAALDLAFAGNKNYVQTLMNTYYEAKNNYKMGGTNLRESDAVGVKFKKHELALLYQKFGAQLEAGLANSTQGQEALRMMQEKGLDKPDKRMKALMIALAVAGVTGLAVTSGAGGALLGVAGAAASNGVDVSKLLALGSTAAAGAGAYGAYKMSQ